MRVILAGGGTGGHLFPGLAVAREFQHMDASTEILFVGTAQGIEFRVIPKEGFMLETLTVKGMKGRGLRGLLDALYRVPASVVRSLGIISRFRPDCVIGLGGYASAPLLVAAKLKRIRAAIMEQNLRPGLTNKAMARWVDRVFTTYRGAPIICPGRVWSKPATRCVGASCRRSNGAPSFRYSSSAAAPAQRINFAVAEALQHLTDLQAQLFIRHQTGQADFTAIQTAYEKLPFEAEVTPFIDQMDEAFAQADLVVCRSGASTVAELTVFGKAAILVPFPCAIYDHQRGNAQALAAQGAAEMILDQDLSGALLAERIRGYFPTAPGQMAAAARALGRPEAAAHIVDECYALVRG
jgi:UDP-N-acetylglucosamine--N-acetylmuramyl-(pentapeptide) pyrophosphoryl-undecaprenol N-acetylglucosamine transferase